MLLPTVVSVGLSSKLRMLVSASVSVPVFKVPGELPGARVAPSPTVRSPTVPEPPRVAPELMVVSELVEMLPLTTRVPALTLVVPV